MITSVVFSKFKPLPKYLEFNNNIFKDAGSSFGNLNLSIWELIVFWVPTNFENLLLLLLLIISLHCSKLPSYSENIKSLLLTFLDILDNISLKHSIFFGIVHFFGSDSVF